MRKTNKSVVDFATLKQNLINDLESKQNHAWNDNIFKCCLYLIKNMSVENEDFQQVLLDGTGEDIVYLFENGYDEEDFLSWVINHEFNLFKDYRFSDRVYLEDYADWDDYVENSGAFYEGEYDCLIGLPNMAVISW